MYDLLRIDRVGNAVDLFGDTTSQSINTKKSDIDEVIDNDRFSYIIRVNQTLGTTDGTWVLFGAEIRYTL